MGLSILSFSLAQLFEGTDSFNDSKYRDLELHNRRTIVFRFLGVVGEGNKIGSGKPSVIALPGNSSRLWGCAFLNTDGAQSTNRQLHHYRPTDKPCQHMKAARVHESPAQSRE